MTGEPSQYGMMDEEIRDRLEKLDWGSIFPELYAYAYARRNYPCLYPGVSPEDLVNDAVQKVLAGERKWNPDKHPDIVIFLKSVIKSIASHALKSHKIMNKCHGEFSQQASDNTAQRQVDDTETRRHYSDIVDQIELALQDDEELLLLFYAMQEGHFNDQDLSEALEMDITTIRNAKKRMRRRISEIKPMSGGT